MSSNLFTPYVAPGRLLRAHMEIDDADMAMFNRLPEGGTLASVDVFDEISESVYTVRRASCGASCFCAAEIVEVQR